MSKRMVYGDAYWKVREEWVGDAAVLFLCRLIYSEKFPEMEISQLEKRVRAATSNSALARFAKKKGYNFGPNKMERVIAQKMIVDVAEAKRFVYELIEFAEEQKLVVWARYKELASNSKKNGPSPFACPKCGTLNIRVHRSPTYVQCNTFGCLHAVHGNFKTPEDAISGWNEEALQVMAGRQRLVPVLEFNGTIA